MCDLDLSRMNATVQLTQRFNNGIGIGLGFIQHVVMSLVGIYRAPDCFCKNI